VICDLGEPFDHDSAAERQTDAAGTIGSILQPISLRYNFKLGRGTVTKIGTTELAAVMSFAPRNLSPQL